MKQLIFERLTNPVEPLPVARSDNDRVADVLRGQGHPEDVIQAMFRNWNRIQSIRSRLGIK